MEKNKDKPKLRFPGFTDPWEQRKYSETFSKLPNNTLSRAELNYNSGLAKNIHYGDVLIKFGELLDVKRDEIPYITDGSLANKFRSSKLQNGDIIIADAAEDETVGKCTELVNVGQDIVISGLHTIPCRPTLSFASGYLGYFMNSSAYHTQLLRLMQGTKVSSISKSALQDTVIFYPFAIAEQKKISELFKQLNNLITLHQRKLNHLQDKKKGLLQKMFPKNGEDFPELRFPGFTDPWEQRKLGDETIDIVAGGDIDKNKIAESGKYPVLANALTNDGVVGYYKEEFRIKAPAVTVTGRGDVGHAQARTIDFTPVVRLLSIKSEHDVYFLENAINNHKVLVESTGVPQLTVPHLAKYEIFFPKNKNEEIAIGNFFTNLDNLITLHQRKLNHLKEQKKSLLQQMFI